MSSLTLILVIVSFGLSFFINAGLIWGARCFKRLLTDHLHAGPQKFHKKPTARLGGLGIYLACWVTGGILFFTDKGLFQQWSLMLLGASGVLGLGLWEDLTGSLKPQTRLLGMLIVGALFVFFTGIKITRVDIPLLDPLWALPGVSIVWTAVALTGLVNAYNIIDGFNGLSSFTGVLSLLSLAFVAFKTQDWSLVTLSLIVVAGVMGFFVLNYPFGFIFLGDNGAYFLGFMAGVLSISLVQRQAQVSAWWAVMVHAYPVMETLFTIYRRRFLKHLSPMMPDGLHLHTLVFRIVTKKFFPWHKSVLRNPLTSTLMWLLNLLAIGPAVIFYGWSPALVLSFVGFGLIYVFLYFYLLCQKMPRWCMVASKRQSNRL